jgi:hypothetical protein
MGRRLCRSPLSLAKTPSRSLPHRRWRGRPVEYFQPRSFVPTRSRGRTVFRPPPSSPPAVEQAVANLFRPFLRGIEHDLGGEPSLHAQAVLGVLAIIRTLENVLGLPIVREGPGIVLGEDLDTLCCRGLAVRCPISKAPSLSSRPLATALVSREIFSVAAWPPAG